MQLLTIADILNNPKEDTDSLILRANDLCDVYEACMDTDKGDAHTRAPGIHASEVSGCERKIVYSLTGTERREESARIWRKRFKVGHYIHAMFQKDFAWMARRMGLGDTVANWHISFEPEITIAPQYQELAKKWYIFSHCDGMFIVRERWDGPAILRILLEIKSEAPDSYMKLKRPRPDHVEQGHVYMACLDTPLIWFLYYNKGNQNFTSSDPTWMLKFDPRVWASLEARFERAHDWAAREVLPPREESVKCEFCPFKWTCQPPTLSVNRSEQIVGLPWQPMRGPGA